ncbi:MAG: four helix bundle protein [Kiritimatiellia bacterium]
MKEGCILDMRGTRDNIVEQKSRAFAIRIVNLFKYLRDRRREDIMSRQVLRSGTSIGANVFEGTYAQSKEDFVNKYSIALKEANETRYWLQLLSDTRYLSATDATAQSLVEDCVELIRILTASIRTAKQKKGY